MKNIAIIGNSTEDETLSKEGFIEEDKRNDFIGINYNSGGPAANAACVVSRFGGKVDFYGQIGNDPAGDFVYKELQKENMNLDHLFRTDEVMTPISHVIINTKGKTRTINTARSLIDYKYPQIFNFECKTGYDYILTDGKYIDNSIELIKSNENAESIIDAGRPKEGIRVLCHFIDYIICSEDFANGVTRMEINDSYENNQKVFLRMKEIYPRAKGIAITIGPRGYICEKDSQILVMPAYKAKEKTIDTNCAGDIFHGAFTYSLASGYKYHDALEFANVTASLSTTKKGGKDSCPDLYTVEKVLRKRM